MAAAGTSNAQDSLHDGQLANSIATSNAQPRDATKPISNAQMPARRTKTGFTYSIVRKDHVDLILLACAFCSGLVDSSMFVSYTTFVSMQTGNTIFLALAISDQGPIPEAWYRPFVAVLSFMIGSVLFSRLYFYMGSPRRRMTLVIVFGLQTMFMIIAAAILQADTISAVVPPTVALGVYPLSLAPISLLAFQSAGQITTSRALEIGELPTVVITSLICDLFSDPKIFAMPKDNIKRNRRVGGFFLTLTGGIAGGWMGRSVGTVSPALWLAAGVKAIITLAWILWPEEPVKEKNLA